MLIASFFLYGIFKVKRATPSNMLKKLHIPAAAKTSLKWHALCIMVNGKPYLLCETAERRKHMTVKKIAKKPAEKKAVVKKTVSAKSSAKKVYTCKTCGRTTTSAKHLCTPGKFEETYVCQFCGEYATDPRHICMPKLEAVEWFCDACGRVAANKNLLCSPKSVK
jgi:hypothetical protein